MRPETIPDILISVVIFLIFFYPRIRHQSYREIIIASLYYFSYVFILYETVFPLCTSLAQIKEPAGSYNLIPFIDIIHHHAGAYSEVFLNILLFMPLGIMLQVYRRHALAPTLGILLTVSLLIELLQPQLSPWRTGDITDVITNVFGGLLGWYLAKKIISARFSPIP